MTTTALFRFCCYNDMLQGEIVDIREKFCVNEELGNFLVTLLLDDNYGFN